MNYRQRKESSFENCDTDGFVSQWANGLMADLEDEKEDIDAAGGCAKFPGLFRREDGARMRAVLITYRCRFSYKEKSAWSFRLPDGSIDRSLGLLPHNENNSTRSRLWREGFEIRIEEAPAEAVIKGSGTGLSGTAWVEVVRTDGGYPADAV